MIVYSENQRATFDDFYNAYPVQHRRYKGRAVRHWDNLTPNDRDLAAMAVKPLNPKCIPATFLRSGQFNDYTPPIIPKAGTDMRRLFDVIVSASENGLNEWRFLFDEGRVNMVGNTLHPRSLFVRNRIDQRFKKVLSQNGFEVAA